MVQEPVGRFRPPPYLSSFAGTPTWVPDSSMFPTTMAPAPTMQPPQVQCRRGLSPDSVDFMRFQIPSVRKHASLLGKGSFSRIDSLSSPVSPSRDMVTVLRWGKIVILKSGMNRQSQSYQISQYAELVPGSMRFFDIEPESDLRSFLKESKLSKKSSERSGGRKSNPSSIRLASYCQLFISAERKVALLMAVIPPPRRQSPLATSRCPS